VALAQDSGDLEERRRHERQQIHGVAVAASFKRLYRSDSG
jgi:hypothetical protein